MQKFYILIFLSLLTPISFAQEDDSSPGEMVTDRPDETEAPNLVAKGYFQVETGAYYKDTEGEVATADIWGYNTTLLRYGLLENLEIRLGIDYVKNRLKVNETILNEAEGFGPLLLGAKIGIAEEEGWRPQIGFMGHLSLPFAASKDFRPETTGVDFRFAFNHQLSERSDFSYNLGAEWRGGSPEAAYIYTISYGYDITDKLGFYAEIYGDFPEKGGSEHNWDGGLTYLLRENLQLDVLVGTGIENDQKLFLGGGVSFRLPN